MKNSTFAGRLLCSTVLSGAMLATAAPAFAQDADDDVIIVTGSRLKDANIASTSPVSTIGSEQFDIRGTVDTIDLLNTLPQIQAGQNSQNTGFANGANGTSTINLRGLGENRTLILVDGKRLPFGSPTTGGFASDINLVPSQLVERVEIVTGGASAVYGSDAVAGVVNFIMKKDFEGFEIDGLFGFNQSGNGSELAAAALAGSGIDPVTGSITDGETWDISGIMGANVDGGRGNVTAYFRYLRNNGVNGDARDFAACALNEGGSTSPASVACTGSNQGPFPTTFNIGLVDTNGLTTPGGQLVIEDDMGNTFLDANGNPLVSGAFSLNEDGSVSQGFNNPFNFGPFNPVRRAVERFNAGFNGYYDIAENVQANLSFGFTQSNSPQIIAPSAAFGSSIPVVNCDNPLLTDQSRALICGDSDINAVSFPRDLDGDGFAPAEIRRRFVEGGNRTDDRTLTNFRVVGGFTGTTYHDWEWEVSGQFAATSLQRLQTNQVTATNIARALDIVDDGTGTPVCRSFLDGTDTACVPFISAYVPGAVNDPALFAYVDTPTLTQGNIQQTVFGGTIQNSLERYGVQSPWAEDAASILFGIEYRRDQLSTQADATNAQGLLVGAGGAVNPTNGSTQVWELYMETAIPLLQGLPYVDELSITGAYRYSNYSSTDLRNNITGGDFNTSTFAAGLSYVPVEDVRIRAQFQRAIRAPNVGELFLPQFGNLTSLSDPCAGVSPTATAAQCANTGLNPALFGLVPPDSGQLNILQGGNPDLLPEVANTYTIGAIIQPRQVDGLLVSLDYFNIAVNDQINTIPPSFALTSCLNTGDPQFCGLINRAPDGSLTTLPRTVNRIDALSVNIAGQDVQGIDGRVTYSYDFGKWGAVNWDYNGTYYIENATTPLPGAGTFDCVGFFNDSCQNPNFEYVHNFTTTYQTNFNVTLNAIWRYRSGVDRVLSIDADTGAITPDTSTFASSLPAVSYFDVSAFWDVAENIRIRAGVNNLLDRDPPIVPTFGPGGPTGNGGSNTYPGNYDIAGRFIFTGVNIRF